MRIVRLYSDERGVAHFEEIVTPPGPDGAALLLKAEGIVNLRRFGPGGSEEWHNAPRRQYVVVLEGRMEVEASDGASRRFGPGDVLLVEDVTGAGHITRTLGKTGRVVLNVPVAPGN